VTSAETLPDRKARVSGTERTIKGHSTWPRTWSQALKNTAVSVPKERWHNSPSEADKRLVRMISMINDATAPVNTWRQDKNRYGKKETLPFRSTIISWRPQIQQTTTSVIIQFLGKRSIGQMYMLHCAPCSTFLYTKYKQKLPARGSKVQDIRSPESKWVQF